MKDTTTRGLCLLACSLAICVVTAARSDPHQVTSLRPPILDISNHAVHADDVQNIDSLVVASNHANTAERDLARHATSILPTPKSDNGAVDRSLRASRWDTETPSAAHGLVAAARAELPLLEKRSGAAENVPDSARVDHPNQDNSDRDQALAQLPDDDQSSLTRSSGSESLDSSDGKEQRKFTSEDDTEILIQPMHSFLLSLTMILFSEVGDKTFLVAALMAMKHDRMTVFSAAFGALLIMTVLSAVLGHAVPTLIPKRLTSLAACILFFVFGFKLLREGMAMSPDEGVTSEMHEVENEIAEKEKEAGLQSGSRMSASTAEMGFNDRRARSQSRFATPPRSPSASPGPGAPSSVPSKAFVRGLYNLFSLILSPAWVQTFVMTFLGEWGDRSQIATIAMAAGQDYWWVTVGAVVGHAICTSVAVLGGRAVAGRVSLKVVTIGGAFAFLLFGVVYLVESIYA